MHSHSAVIHNRRKEEERKKKKSVTTGCRVDLAGFLSSDFLQMEEGGKIIVGLTIARESPWLCDLRNSRDPGPRVDWHFSQN